MKKHLIIAAYMICFVCCPLFAATHSNETCQASFSTNEQTQSTDWKSLGKINVYYNGSTSSPKTVNLYITKVGEPICKIKDSSYEYIVTPNPQYDPDYDSGKYRFKYIAGKYYFNLDLKNIMVQSTADWKSLGKINAYYNGSTSSPRTVNLYITKVGESICKIKDSSYEYIVTPNPQYDPDYDSGKYRFKYAAGKYYFNFDLKNIMAQSTADWKSLGKINVYYNGSTSSPKTVNLYITKKGEPICKIKDSSYEYIVTPNPQYDPDYDSGKYKFKYIAGKYYLYLSPALFKKD